MIKEIKLTDEMLKAARDLGEGPIVYAYQDHNAIRMETADGEDPYVWRDDTWRKMPPPSMIKRKLK